MDFFDFDNIVCYFFDRDSGFSDGLFSSLNCSRFVGDNPESVEKNLEFVRKSVGAKKLITLNQIHSAKCVIVDENSESDQEADALVTQSEGVALGILTADCVPVLLADPVKKIVGAAHAGWKGAKSGVIENTIEKMVSLGSSCENMISVIGPCVHVESYEVGKDFLDNFPPKYFSKICDKYHFDVVKFCCDRLREKGISKISVNEIDTFKNHEKYFSFRYAKKNSDGICGRNISVICIKPTT
ncbi:MAG: peptidoglycan editing factor PgeF [Alphaproteobacteria bacterium]|nr:peptidoglycan editing factor PgeF [Alphaproteobacteria bacterium]